MRDWDPSWQGSGKEKTRVFAALMSASLSSRSTGMAMPSNTCSKQHSHVMPFLAFAGAHTWQRCLRRRTPHLYPLLNSLVKRIRNNRRVHTTLKQLQTLFEQGAADHNYTCCAVPSNNVLSHSA